MTKKKVLLRGAALGIALAVLARWRERLLGLLPGRRGDRFDAAGPSPSNPEYVEDRMTEGLPGDELGPPAPDETLPRPQDSQGEGPGHQP